MAGIIDLLITDGMIVTEDGVFSVTIAVREGQIVNILEADARPESSSKLSAKGLHILPGLIDSHVHLRSPGYEEREDPLSGTSAAAAGGITTLLEMPVSNVNSSSAEGLYKRGEAIQTQAVIDFGLYGGAGHQNIDHIPEIAAAGAVAFKTFLIPPPEDREAEFHGLWCLDNLLLQKVMEVTATTGLRHCFHCEDWSIVQPRIIQLISENRHDPLAHAQSRPSFVEDSSVAKMLSIAASVGGPVEVVHLSSPEAAQLIKDSRSKGVDVIAETCPQYLFFTDQVLSVHQGFAKCNPPLRPVEEVEALWKYLNDGTLDFVGSDHSPFLPDEKCGNDIFKIPPGLPGLESMAPMMLTAVNNRQITITDFIRLMSTRQAEVFQLPGKGRIDIGYDADLTFVDMGARWTFDRRFCFSKAKDTMRIVHGMPMKGKIQRTMVRGETVYYDGKITCQPGYGRWIKP